MSNCNCLKCGKPIEKPAKQGRPPKYCGNACRRAAEFELRRINDHIAKLESNFSHARLHGRSSTVWLPPGTYEAEIARFEERLRALLIEQGEE